MTEETNPNESQATKRSVNAESLKARPRSTAKIFADTAEKFNRQASQQSDNSLDQDIASYILDKPHNTKANTNPTSAKDAERKKAIKMAEAASSLASFGLLNHSPMDDNFEERDELDFHAVHILDLLRNGVFNFVELTKTEKNIIFRYFYRTNPILGRILELHTDIPLSKIRLNPPPGLPDILRDYVMKFFRDALRKINFNAFLRDFVLSTWIYGYAHGLIDDDYSDGNKVIEDVSTAPRVRYEESEDIKEFLLKAETDYSKNPGIVDGETRAMYLRRKLKDGFDDNYTGPNNIRTVGFWEIGQYYENKDTGYEAATVFFSPAFRDIQKVYTDLDECVLKQLGYSSGMSRLLIEGINKGNNTFEVDSDHEQGNPFIFSMKRSEGISPINRVIDDLIGWEASRKAILMRIDATGKVGRLISAPDLSGPQVDALRAEVELMLQDPDYAIVVNYDVRWEEVMKDFKDELRDVVDTGIPIQQALAMGLSMPESMIGGESMYSGQTIQLDIINIQYRNFKEQLQTCIEDKVFRPIALRKGFVIVNGWGEKQVVHPQLSFSRIDLRADAMLDVLNNLYLKGSLPVEVIYELLNLEPEEMRRGIIRDSGTPMDPVYNDLIRDLFSSAGPSIFQQTDFLDKVIRNSGFNKLHRGLAVPPPEDGGF